MLRAVERMGTIMRPALVVAGLVAMTTATIGVVGAAGASAPTAGASDRTAPSSIITAWPADITSLDPANLSTGSDYEMAKNIYEPLIQQKFVQQKHGVLFYNDNALEPDLAKTWTVGAHSITFHIRPGVKFYGTNDVVTAQDVKWSLSRLWSTPAAGDLAANGLQHPSQIHVVSEDVVRIDYMDSNGKPVPVGSTAIAMFREPWMGIVDEAAVKKHETAQDPSGSKWLRSHDAGTGPYYIASRTPGVNIVLKAVPNHWAPAPTFTTITIRIASSSIASLLESGQINVGEVGLTNQQLNTLASKGLDVVHGNTTEFDILAIGSGNNTGPLSKLDVRKAIADAIPYQQIVKSVLFGRGTRDYSIVASQAPAYTPAWSEYTTNLTKAKSLMAAAGNPTAAVPLYYLQGDVDQQATALLIQANLRAIGISANLDPVTQAGLFNTLSARATPPKNAKIGPPGLVLFNWHPWKTDPKIVIGYWATKGGINNYSRWWSPVVDNINTKWAPQAPSKARANAYKKAQRIIAAAAPVVPIAVTGRSVVVAKGITEVDFGSTPGLRFWLLSKTGVTNPLDKLFGK